MNENITATLTLTKDQWTALIYHVKCDLEMCRVGLAPQIGKDEFSKLENNANAILNEVKRATSLSC